MDFAQLLLFYNRPHAGHIPPQGAQLRQTLGLARGALKSYLPNLRLCFAELDIQFRPGQLPKLIRVHSVTIPRLTNFVLMGSLWLASAMACLATSNDTPSISNNILPGRTPATPPPGA